MGARYSSEVGRPKQINCSNQFPTSRVRLADWAIGGDLSPVGVLFLIELPEREPNSTERQRTPRNGKFSQLPTGPTAAQPSSLHMFQPQRVIVLLVWSALPPGQRKFCFARCCQQLFASIFTTRFSLTARTLARQFPSPRRFRRLFRHQWTTLGFCQFDCFYLGRGR